MTRVFNMRAAVTDLLDRRCVPKRCGASGPSQRPDCRCPDGKRRQTAQLCAADQPGRRAGRQDAVVLERTRTPRSGRCVIRDRADRGGGRHRSRWRRRRSCRRARAIDTEADRIVVTRLRALERPAHPGCSLRAACCVRSERRNHVCRHRRARCGWMTSRSSLEPSRLLWVSYARVPHTWSRPGRVHGSRQRW